MSDVLILLADISGYTRFMVANQTEVEHSQQIIGALLEAIIDEVEIPLSIAKFEGDAVFLYAIKDGNGDAVTRSIRDKLPKFFAAFSSKLLELAAARTCACGACRNVNELTLKVIAHSGQAVIYTIADRTELAGVDVIIAHRLLKNSIAAREYILATESAKRDLRLDLPLLQESTEEVEDIGPIKVTVYRPSFTNSSSHSSRAASVNRPT
jgi:class 3 adenylate cyclase